MNSFHQEIMFWLPIAEAGCSYFNQKNHQSVEPLVSLNPPSSPKLERVGRPSINAFILIIISIIILLLTQPR